MPAANIDLRLAELLHRGGAHIARPVDRCPLMRILVNEFGKEGAEVRNNVQEVCFRAYSPSPYIHRSLCSHSR
jgi:hypothetical protein